MLTAMSRLKSNNWMDKFYGFAFYISFLTLIGIPLYIGFNIEIINIKTGILIILGLTFIFTIMESFADYKNISKIHSGTLEHFVTSINPRRSNFVQELFFNGEMNYFYPMMSGLSVFFGIVCVFYKQSHPFSSNFECFYLFILVLYVTLLVFLANNINILDVNKQKVASKSLFVVNELNDLTDDHKRRFKKFIESDVRESGLVNRYDIKYIYQSMIDDVNRQKELDLKRKEIEEYNEFTKK